MSYIICDLCGGKTLDLKVHREGSSRQCFNNQQALRVGRAARALEAAGWRRAGRFSRLIRTSVAPLRNEPTALGEGTELWAPHWAQRIASVQQEQPWARRRAILYFRAAMDVGCTESLAALEAVWSVGGATAVWKFTPEGVSSAVQLAASLLELDVNVNPPKKS